MSNITLFSQIIKKIERSIFKKLVEEKQTDKACKGFDSWTHLVSMLFCHFAKSTSVRDISNGLRSATGNLNHLGIAKAPSKSSISYQNKRRDSDLFKELYYGLLKHLGQQASLSRVKLRIKAPVYLLDSTVVSLCLSMFDWATFRTKKGAVKMHTLLDYDGKLPVYVNITEGSMADNKGAYDIPLEKGSVIVADRYYNDFPMLNIWDSKGVFFVIRHKDNLKFSTINERQLPENTAQEVLIDEEIELVHQQSKVKYPGKLRRVAVWDEKNQQTVELITNNFKWSAKTIGDLYRCRWEIEIFFRDIKQLLHIKTFIGTSKNAVMIQIWTALITILLLKVMKATAKFGWHLSNLVAFIRLNIFVKIELQKWLDKPFEDHEKPPQKSQQGVLFPDYR
ncbi:transposase family protein [Belliella baltica DSM 15883]|uniref:Transposase family protein n=1 Tax=Belliella baltica (strain DSM 15883 / CIP 108006 / LMG 21964 / BA134) TaxID=866536 RepID=I3Z3I0_BELBD|nr:IS4 family transposase [Belliella baltica]AFL83072.1 transposase family protein [Belliella baltica DSM 15883]AFL83798.1 transposase family protein [Belliella baltica DSM 15883]